MKKLLLAVAVSSVAAGSANAATVYEKDGFTYKLNGDFQVQMRQNIGDETKSLGVDFDDMKLENEVSYDLGGGLSGFGSLTVDFKDDAEDGKDASGDEIEVEESYVGMEYSVFAVSFGRRDFATDEFGIEEAYEEPIGEDQFEATDETGDDAIRVDVEFDNIYVAASHEMDANDTDGVEGEYYDLFVGTEFAGLELGAAYKQAKIQGPDSKDTWGVSAAYDLGIAGLAADYSVTDEANGNPETTLYNVAATFDVASTTGVALGMQNQEEDGNEDVTGWYANVTYKFPEAKNVRLFAEVADTDEDNMDLGYLAGLRVKF